MRLFLLAVCVSAATLLLSGCNTMEGFGKDVKKTGEKIEKSAERHK